MKRLLRTALSKDISRESPSPPPCGPVSPEGAACDQVDVARSLDLGLGRGIDATNPKPWLNKTSFQVRRVVYDELIGTEEGGTLNQFTNQIKSSVTLQKSLLSAVTQSKSPVRVEVDGEIARSLTATPKSVGRKVVNRTISYREDCAPESARGEAVSHGGFEERLWRWICEQVEFPISENVPVLESFDKLVNQASDPGEQRAKVIEACRAFVHVFRATHYVTAIELGAVEYTVEFPVDFEEHEASAEPQSGSGSLNRRSSLRRGSKGKYKEPRESIQPGIGLAAGAISAVVAAKSEKRIGIINDDGTVTRRSHGEAVIAVKMQPVSRLIKQPFLKLALQLAMVHFIEEHIDKEGGPYLMGLNDGNVFLSVIDDCVVGATTDVDDAAPFYISQPEDNEEPVLISYYKKTVIDEHSAKLKVHKIARYLQIATTGPNAGSLEVQYNVRKESYCRFVFHDRFKRKPVTGDMEEAIADNNEGYYIKCCGVSGDSFLAVVKQPAEGGPLYKTVCHPISKSFDSENVFMLFQIICPAHARYTETHSDQVKGIISQLKRYEVARLE